mmetsp:Transcript_8696/g.12916  ORF Transcript_8696/g.12916 Transcript_8696/m.12916 type:complete len:323 (-) Transcript_8696:458-1426(-)
MMHITNTIIGVVLALASGGVQATYTDDALFRQNFETASEDWDFHEELRIQDYHSQGMYHGRILRVNYPPDDRGSPRVNNNFNLEEEVTSATLSFDVKLHSQFEFVKGGKMHGLGGGTTTTGCIPIDSDGWSVRVMWRGEGVPELYVYHQDRSDTCGDRYTPENFHLERGTWYRIDLQVQMNSSPGHNDGKAVLFIDGKKLVEANGLRLSGTANVNIDTFMFATFYGGADSSWSPSKTTFVYYDNFTVSRGMKVTGERGTECEMFLNGIYHPGSEICCASSCGSCGGSGCADLPGGDSQCCTGAISNSGASCDMSFNAACVFS